MYLPKDTEEMFDILDHLRIFAEANAMVDLAECLADAGIMLQAHEARHPTSKRAQMPGDFLKQE